MGLTPFEHALVDHARSGHELDAANGETIDAGVGDRWGPERTVRAAVLEAIIGGAYGPVHRRGV